MKKGPIRLFIDKNIFIIDASKYLNLLEGSHRIFFEIALGVKIDLNRKCYVLDNESFFFELIPEITNYLKDNSIEFTLDDEVEKFLCEYNLEQKLFEEAKKIGSEIKKKPVYEISIPSLKRTLMPYQVNAINHLVSIKHSANFSVPGSGKTTIVYSTYSILKENKEISKLLVIGPRSCFFPWEEEYKLCFERAPKSARLVGPKKSRLAKYFQWDQYELFLCTYQTASNDVDDLISLCKKSNVFLVLDESHYIKKFEGGVWAEAILKLSSYAKKRTVLSGTPMPNSLRDLWTQMSFLWPTSLILGERGSYYHFSENKNNIGAIQKKIEPFFYRICKSDLNLPPPKYNKIIVKPGYLQQRIYSALAAKYLKEIEMSIEERIYLREWRKARIVRLMQTASNPAILLKYSEEFNIPPLKTLDSSLITIIQLYPKYEIPGKIKYAIKLLNQLMNEDNKVIVWTHFVHNIKMLSKLIKEVKPLIIYGAIPADENESIEFNREQQIKKFKESKEPEVLLANPAACAESISLHKVCHHAIYLDRTFNCGQYMQSLDRIHRVGLNWDEAVYYHLLICSETIDETIDRRLLEKQNTMNSILEDKNIPLGALDIELSQLGRDEDEEIEDFLAVIKDMRRYIADTKDNR